MAGKDGRDGLIAGMEHYYDPDDFNKRFYHATGEGSRSASFKRVKELVKAILKDALKLLDSCKAAFGETGGYRLLLR